MFGGGECGQLGMGTNLLDCDAPNAVSLTKRVIRISNGENHTACITGDTVAFLFSSVLSAVSV